MLPHTAPATAFTLAAASLAPFLIGKTLELQLAQSFGKVALFLTLLLGEYVSYSNQIVDTYLAIVMRTNASDDVDPALARLQVDCPSSCKISWTTAGSLHRLVHCLLDCRRESSPRVT